jgi:hypothetical protein
VAVGLGLVEGGGGELLGAGGVDESEGLGVVEGLVVGDGLPDDVVPEAEAFADVEAAVVRLFLVASTTFFGTVEHVVLVAVPAATLALAARAWPNMPNARKAIAVSAPSAAGLMISGLNPCNLAPVGFLTGQALLSGLLTVFAAATNAPRRFAIDTEGSLIRSVEVLGSRNLQG